MSVTTARGARSAFCVPVDPDVLWERGRAARTATPRRMLGVHTRRDPQVAVRIVEETNRGRLPHLVPLRMGRMAASPFAFLRGAAAVMAHDLTGGPMTRLTAQVCGDAHVSNFGFYASPERQLVMDINDFDETARGPFDIDLRRLAASIAVAGREIEADRQQIDEAVSDASWAYRTMMFGLADMHVMDAWNVAFDAELLELVQIEDLGKVLGKAVKKAKDNNSRKVATKWTTSTANDGQRFVEEPPVLTQVTGAEEEAVVEALDAYVGTLAPERALLLSRYSIGDVAFRVVGVGSVGNRTYVVLLQGNGPDDALVLQLKEARPSSLTGRPGCHVAPGHQGERVVRGQKAMQTASDPLLGWTGIGTTEFYVRTFRDMKGGIDPSALAGHQLDDYARLTGALLARAHARTADSRVLAGYLGQGDTVDTALVEYANAYADQTEADHAALVEAVGTGRLPSRGEE